MKPKKLIFQCPYFYKCHDAKPIPFLEDNVEYEIFTILEERDTQSNVNSYIQIMVKNQDTKQ